MSELKPVTTIPPQGWMQAEKTRQVMACLNDGADADAVNALFVGGCVRNALLEKQVDDIDIATRLTPDQVMERLNAAKIKVIPTGIDHGTVTAVMDGTHFEITTLRRDVETDGRRAVVAYSDNWAEDAQRRDFTMNTLLCDLAGNIYDPTGRGLTDLRAGKVLFVGDAGTRIAEDHLRVLRLFRFHALYGKGDIDQAALAACKEAADKVYDLSRERITQEFFKILLTDAPQDLLAVMFENGILKAFECEGYQPEFLKHLCFFQDRYALGALSSRLLVLSGLSFENLAKMQNYLLIPKVIHKDMQSIMGALDLPDLSDAHAMKVAVYKHGRIPAAQALMIELAQDRAANAFAPKALEIIQNWDVPTFPVTGNDLIAQGHKPGPDLGKTLTQMEQAWIDNGFSLPG